MTETAVMIVDRRLCVRQAYKLDPLDSIQGAIACKLGEMEDGRSVYQMRLRQRQHDGDSSPELRR